MLGSTEHPAKLVLVGLGFGRVPYSEAQDFINPIYLSLYSASRYSRRQLHRLGIHFIFLHYFNFFGFVVF